MRKEFLFVIILSIVLAIAGLLLFVAPNIKKIETKEIEGKIINKTFWFVGPVEIGEDGPWYYHNYAALKILCENGKTYSITRYLFTGTIMDPALGYKKGDQVICEVILDESELLSFRKK